METVGARALRATLSTALRRAQAGERLVVTVDGHPVAELGPLGPGAAPSLEALAAAGLLQPPRRRDAPGRVEPLDMAVDVRLGRVLDEVRGA